MSLKFFFLPTGFKSDTMSSLTPRGIPGYPGYPGYPFSYADADDDEGCQTEVGRTRSGAGVDHEQARSRLGAG